MSDLKIISTDQYGVTYADPTDPNYSVRFKTTNTRKSVDGKSLDNYVAEIIYNDQNDVTIGSDTISEALSVRVRVSGSNLSQARLAAICDKMATEITLWDDEGVLQGFRPTTVPTTIV